MPSGIVISAPLVRTLTADRGDAGRRLDSDRFAELFMLGLDAARGARERARLLDNAFSGNERGIAGRA